MKENPEDFKKWQEDLDKRAEEHLVENEPKRFRVVRRSLDKKTIERLKEHDNVESALEGMNYWEIKDHMRARGWEHRSDIELGPDTGPERALEGKLGNNDYRIVLLGNQALIFTRHGEVPIEEI